METFKVAHIKEQGVDIIIVLVSAAFDLKTTKAKHETIAALTFCAHKAGLAGTVVPVWPHGTTFGFLAPHSWHAFFASLDLATLAANVNIDLTCG